MEDIEYLISDSAEMEKMRVSQAEEKACQPTAHLFRIASPRKGVDPMQENSHEQPKSCQKNRR